MAEVNEEFLDRRWFLGATAAGFALLLPGCSVDPRIGDGRPSPSRTTGTAPVRPSPSASGSPPAPTPTFAGAADGSALERRLAATAAGIEQRWRQDLDERRAVLTALRDSHLAHAAALVGPNPTARPTSPSPRLSPSSPRGGDTLPEALNRLARAETAAAATHQTRALASTGFSALLWGSLGVAATAFAQTASALAANDDLPAVARPRAPRALPTLSDVEAQQQLVKQLHAVVYGYQLAIGQLTSASSKSRALKRLRDQRRLRDNLIRQLVARSAEVPVAAPAYVPSVRPTNPSTAGRLIRSVERSLTPFVGLWLAAAPRPADRTSAYAALAATDAAARTWGASVVSWPGWND